MHNMFLLSGGMLSILGNTFSGDLSPENLGGLVIDGVLRLTFRPHIAGEYRTPLLRVTHR